MNNELSQFVKESLNKGLSREKIAKVLATSGWQDDEVKNALNSFADIDFPIPVPKRRPYTSAREAFMYLVIFLTLYISSLSFGTLLFQFIARWLPDPLIGYDIYDATANTIRWSTASIIIAFPIYLWVSSLIMKAIHRNPDMRSSKIRKWLTYITLFIAAGVIIGDLITLVFNLLGGEFTLRFILKVLTVGAIAGSIFGYYLWDLRGEESETKA